MSRYRLGERLHRFYGARSPVVVPTDRTSWTDRCGERPGLLVTGDSRIGVSTGRVGRCRRSAAHA